MFCPKYRYQIFQEAERWGRIHEDHEVVGKIKEWLDAQANAGRFGEVSDEEMLIQVRKYIPQYLS